MPLSRRCRRVAARRRLNRGKRTRPQRKTHGRIRRGSRNCGWQETRLPQRTRGRPKAEPASTGRGRGPRLGPSSASPQCASSPSCTLPDAASVLIITFRRAPSLLMSAPLSITVIPGLNEPTSSNGIDAIALQRVVGGRSVFTFPHPDLSMYSEVQRQLCDSISRKIFHRLASNNNFAIHIYLSDCLGYINIYCVSCAAFDPGRLPMRGRSDDRPLFLSEHFRCAWCRIRFVQGRTYAQWAEC